MSVRPYIDQFSISFYEHLVGFNRNKVKSLQDAFDNEVSEADSSIGEDYKLVESYYVDKRKSNKIDPETLRILIDQLKNSIDIKKDFKMEFATLKAHPRECRFFFRVYNRKFDEFSRLILKINPFPINTKSNIQWQRAINLNQTHPVFRKFETLYNNWKLNAMTCSHIYLEEALRMDLKNRSSNNKSLTRFTYCADKEREVKNRIAFRVINRTFIVIGIVFGLKMLLEPSSRIDQGLSQS